MFDIRTIQYFTLWKYNSIHAGYWHVHYRRDIADIFNIRSPMTRAPG